MLEIFESYVFPVEPRYFFDLSRSIPLKLLKAGSTHLGGFAFKLLDQKPSNSPNLFFIREDGNVIFSDEEDVYITPIHPDIFYLLEKNGFSYLEFPISTPVKLNHRDQASFELISSIAKPWIAYQTTQMANDYSYERGVHEKTHVLNNFLLRIFLSDEEITETSTDGSTRPMVGPYLTYGVYNIGTFAWANKKCLLVCDRFGRSFIIKGPSILLKLMVNKLMRANYVQNKDLLKYVRTI